MIFRIILWSFIIGTLFRFVFRFLVPIFKMTSMAQSHLQKMQRQMEDMQQPAPAPAPAASKPKHVDGDYIDYEEIK